MKKKSFLVGLSGWIIFSQLLALVGPVPVTANGKSFGTSTLKEWEETTYVRQGDELPINLEMIENPDVMAGFTREQKAFLSKNGFVVLHTGDEQFSDIRERVGEVYGQPYYLTTDAAFHALHVNFDALLKQLEKTVLNNEAAAIVRAAFNEVSRDLPAVKGTSIEKDAQLAQDYLAVALVLFDSKADLPQKIKERVQPQIEQIRNAAGRDQSVLIPDLIDDYGAYKPVSHYAGDPVLENYFRAMTWVGRVYFKFNNTPKPSRAPLIITRAMRADGQTWNRYLRLMETLTFVIGPTDDGGPVELAVLMDSVFGMDASLEDLANDDTWRTFLANIDRLPQAQINSAFENTSELLEKERSWRMMGQRFTLDAMIFQNLIYDRVGTPANPRKFPSGLDLMAVFGSDTARETQKAAGEDKYENYTSQMKLMRDKVQSLQQSDWLGTFYSGWLYSFTSQVKPKGEAYPPVMQTDVWRNREVNSALGSWAELKHDTVLYTKMAEGMGGGGPPGSPPPPGYVEANPNVFYRLGYISQALGEGLMNRNYFGGDPSDGSVPLDMMISGMNVLAAQFIKLGDIAVKELRGEELTEEDRYAIYSRLGTIENQALAMGSNMEMPPVPVIAAVSGYENDVLEAGVGRIDRIYVVVPLNKKLQIAQGGIFTYYEFTQPRSNRLTDEEWRKKLVGTPGGQLSLAKTYTLKDGKAVNALAFRVGDVYLITKEGGNPPLNLREKPSKSAKIVDMLKEDMYFEITDGPEKADNLTWWKIKVFGFDREGWVAQNPDWYDRAHGQ
ncbi:hypothetical protein hrd7_15060 [Leptolinea sp. HRD-7]|nr:hypothetical protein hrd7_15060 [Leptolinea sp. HRD-7]